MDGNVSLSDIAALDRNNDGFGNSAWWVIILFAMIYGWGNGGFGGNAAANAIGYENLATSNEVQRGFDNQNTMANQREILSAVNAGTAQAVAATNQTFHDTVNALSNRYEELQRDIANVQLAAQANQSAQQECCCNVLRAVDGVNYNLSQQAAAINANTTAQTQKVLDAITGNRMAQMQDQINQLQMQTALAGVVRYPMQTAYTSGMNPFCGCGCAQG